MTSFAGYVMPIQYKGVNFEHNHVRKSIGVFDVSHMAQILLSGQRAFDLIQKITTNNVSKLIDGKVQYSCMLNFNGGIIDDLLVYRFTQDSYMLVVNAANTDKDINWICSHNDMGVEVVNSTPDKGLLAIQGPKTNLFLQKLTDIDLSSIPYYSFKVGKIANCPNIIISNTGYNGSGGFELYVDKSFASTLWHNLFLDNDVIEPIGLAARDTLRLEMGYCLYGNDIDESKTPVEAGLSWIVGRTKQFIGKDIIIQQLEKGVDHCLVGFICNERGIPRKGYQIINNKHDIIGEVTSGSMSPSLQTGFGLGYVNKAESALNNNIFVSIRNKKISARVVKIPFYEK